MDDSSPDFPLPHQLILFGSPGTGKSHHIESELKKKLRDPVAIKTVFHPEYSHGDFFGKLLPLTNSQGRVEYRYYAGHFLQALAQALAFSNTQEKRDVLLVIDEINRGNSAAIFGAGFQLLDRDDDGWSSYHINISDMEKAAMLAAMKAECHTRSHGGKEQVTWEFDGKTLDSYPANGQIKLPPNLYIVATMNTSDESIYYMDSAFKRRWAWQYVPIDGEHVGYAGTLTEAEWKTFIAQLNGFIRAQAAYVRKVEDKQVGYYFIRAKNGLIQKSDIQNKLMFFIWDTVFPRDKTPLDKLLGKKSITFGEFSNQAGAFFDKIIEFTP
jgi:5-methylcytosine-specific restriction endonuclease McrBC GTP-binding regulatory subunit McrB